MVMFVCVRASNYTSQRSEGWDLVSKFTSLQFFPPAAYTAGDVVPVHSRIY